MNSFPEGSRVCFVGDSITYSMTYIAHIVNFYRNNLKERKVEFYNCGISGASLSVFLSSFDEYISIYNPTHIVLMIGVNDSARWRLSQNRDLSRYENLKNAFERYKSNINEFYNIVKKKCIKLILCAPAPYAEYQDTSGTPLKGGYALIQGYANFIQQFAKENGIPFCDYHSYITKSMQDEALYQDDCVHLTPRGHYYIAKCFLDFQGFNLGDEKPIPDHLNKWIENVQRHQTCANVENLIIPGSHTKSFDERIETVKEYLKHDHSNEELGAYFTDCAKQYLEYKPNQKKYFAEITEFMKNQ